MDWKLFFSTFSLIFVAELPDKTALATVMMATRSKPLPIFIGVALAFVVQTMIAVLFGSAFGKLPEKWVHFAAGVLFLIFAWVAWREDEAKDEAKEERDIEKFGAGRSGLWRVAWSSFLVIFIAEWGDLTQLASASLVAKYHAPLTIFASSVLALWCVTAIAIFVGNRAKGIIRPAALQRIAAVAFACVGGYFLTSWFRAFIH